MIKDNDDIGCGICPDKESKEIEYSCIKCKIFLCMIHKQEHTNSKIYKNHAIEKITMRKKGTKKKF
jgi:hypothetical protein